MRALSLLDLPRELQLVWWTVVGLFVGSFLNVAIHRLPREGMSVSYPRRSQCPSCARSLTWKENVPLLSWLVQRGRCRGCGWRIPWRYPLVELLTACLWLLVAWLTPPEATALLVVRLTVVSGLIVATFVDWACFEIPDEVSLGGLALAPLASLLVPRLHESTRLAQLLGEQGWGARGGALAGSLAGILVGGGVLLAIGWLGKLVYKRDAMGLGDVKLLAAGGGFVGPGGALAALMIAALLASIAGLGNMLRFLVIARVRARRRGSLRSFASSVRTARVAGRYLPFGPYLALGIGIVLLAWNHVSRWP